MAGDTDLPADRSDQKGEKLCDICLSSIRKSCIKCANDKCSVRLHTKCFEQVAKLFLTTRRDWKCKSCSDFDNTNTPDDLTSLKYQVSYLKRENELLIDLNTELKQNNELLKQNNFELSDKIATQNNSFLPIHAGTTSTVSYSNVLQKTMNNKVTPFSLVIKSTNKENSNIDILSDIQRRVKLADLNVCINSTKQIKNGVVLNCEDELSLEKLKTSIQKKVGSSYNISESQKYNPRLIIKHMQVDSSLESHEDIIENIFSMNQLEPFTTEDLKIVTILKYSHSKSQDVIIEVCPKLRKQILERSYLYLGWKRCSVSDYIRVIRCYQCSGIGHISKICKHQKVCPHCSEEHSINECGSNFKKCINCVNYNIKHKTRHDVNHSTKETNNCWVLQNHINNLKSNIIYE